MFVEGKNACVRRLAPTELRPPAPPRLCTFRRGRALPSEPPRSAVFRHAALLAARRNQATCGLSRPRLLRRQRRRGRDRGCRRSGSTGRGSEQQPRARTSCRPCSALTCVLRLPPPPARLPRLHPRLPGGDSERREQHSPPLRLPTALGAASHKRRAEAWDRLWDGTRAIRVERIRCWVRSQKGQQK